MILHPPFRMKNICGITPHPGVGWWVGGFNTVTRGPWLWDLGSYSKL
jgi:hypothetical protein